MSISFQKLHQHYLPAVCDVAFEAGKILSKIYHEPGEILVKQKGDGTPVTRADECADAFIYRALQVLDVQIPVVSEESVCGIPFEERKAWQTYWLVDPLDGTKEFINGSGEFSVNIALIHHERPILGVVFAPEIGDLYLGLSGLGLDGGRGAAKAGKIEGMNGSFHSCKLDWPALVDKASPITVADHPVLRLKGGKPVRVAVSCRQGAALHRYMSQLPSCTKIKMGAALKTCLVAEGRADIYPRLGPTSLWDTAAAHCILQAAGGAILNASGHSLHYVQTPSLLNPFFIAVGHVDYPWPSFLEAH